MGMSLRLVESCSHFWISRGLILSIETKMARLCSLLLLSLALVRGSRPKYPTALETLERMMREWQKFEHDMQGIHRHLFLFTNEVEIWKQSTMKGIASSIFLRTWFKQIPIRAR